MKKVIEKARLLNPNFDELTVQQQYEFIKGNINRNIIPEELAYYYNSQWNHYPSYVKEMY
jgi:hypothetical protein